MVEDNADNGSDDDHIEQNRTAGKQWALSLCNVSGNKERKFTCRNTKLAKFVMQPARRSAPVRS